MNFEKEKIVAIVNPKLPLDEKSDYLRNKIQHEIHNALSKLNEIIDQNTKVIPKNFPIPEITVKDILIDEHVDFIKEHPNKRKFRLVIFQNSIPNSTEYDWVPKHKIRFVIEYIVSEGDIHWHVSSNNYSARVMGKISQLDIVLLDIFVDILIEGSLSRNRKFRHLYSKNRLNNIINSTEKIKFITIQTKKTIDPNLNYFPFSTFFRILNANKIDYDIPNLVVFWEKYLFYVQGILNEIPKVRNSNDLIKLIPQSYQKQINKVRLKKGFEVKCSNNGHYKFIMLIKSEIGSTAKVKRQLDTLFKGKVTKNKTNFIPLEFSHVLNGLNHLLLRVTFEKI